MQTVGIKNNTKWRSLPNSQKSCRNFLDYCSFSTPDSHQNQPKRCVHLWRAHLPHTHTELCLLKCCFTSTATLKEAQLTSEGLGVTWVRHLAPNPATLNAEREKNFGPSPSDPQGSFLSRSEASSLWQSLKWLWPPPPHSDVTTLPLRSTVQCNKNLAHELQYLQGWPR